MLFSKRTRTVANASATAKRHGVDGAECHSTLLKSASNSSRGTTTEMSLSSTIRTHYPNAVQVTHHRRRAAPPIISTRLSTAIYTFDRRPSYKGHKIILRGDLEYSSDACIKTLHTKLELERFTSLKTDGS